MQRHNDFFTPDAVDEQVEHLLRSTRSHPSQRTASINSKLIQHLHTLYQEESAEADRRSLERVGTLLQQAQGLIFDQDDGIQPLDIEQAAPGHSETRLRHPSLQPRKHKAWHTYISLIAAIIVLTILVGSMVLVLGQVHNNRNGVGKDTGSFIYTLQMNNLYKLDLQHRTTIWSTSFLTDGYYPNSPAEYNGIVYISTSLSVSEHVHTRIPYVSAYNAHTGALLWRTSLDPKNVSGVDLGSIIQPVVANGRVYTISDAGKIYALNPLTGSRLWVYDTHQIAMLCTTKQPDCGIFHIPDITVGNNGAIYASIINHLFALNGINGSQIWSASILSDRHIDSLVFSQDTLYLTSTLNRFDIPASRYHNLHAFNATTGQQRWSVSKLSAGFGTPIITRGVVYIGSNEGTVYAFRNSDGSLLWQRATSGQLLVNLSVANDTIYVQANVIKVPGVLHPASSTLAALNAADGSPRWQRSIDTHNTIPEHQIVTGGIIYLVTFVLPPSQADPGHFVIDAYSAVNGHKL